MKANKTKSKRQSISGGRSPYSLLGRPFSGPQLFSSTGGVSVPGQRSTAMPFVRNELQSATKSLTPPVFGPCFNCGKLGHFRRACPLLSSKS